MNSAARSLISAFTTVALIMALAATPCSVACGTEARVSSGSPPCCNPDGHCKDSAGGTPCLKTHSQTPALVEQTIHLVPVGCHVNLDAVQLTVSQYRQAELPPAAQYSPPYLYLLHASFLI